MSDLDEMHHRARAIEDLVASPGWSEVLRPSLEATLRKVEALLLDGGPDADDLYAVRRLRAERKFLRLLVDRPGELVRDIESALRHRGAKEKAKGS